MKPPAADGAPGLGELLSAWGRQSPQAPALLASGRPTLTYGGLLAQLRRIASALAGAAILPGNRVAIVLPNGPDMAVAALATAACAVCAPLNPAYGVQELRFHLGNLRPKALILREEEAGPARSVAAELGIRCLEASCEVGSPAGVFELRGFVESTSAAMRFPASDDVALVLHTSGTTSRPKIVPLTQRNLCRSAANIASSLRLGPQDRSLNVMPLYHVHGFVGALLASLSVGASVACTPGMQEMKFLAWLAEFEPTWYTAVPTIHDTVLRGLSGRPSGTLKHRLRFVRSCSAPLPAKVSRELEAALGVPVIEAYGMTEAAHQIASNPLPPFQRKAGTVGVAAGSEIAIMGEDRRLLSAGESGEIVVRGENVIRGYGANPEATRAAFADGWFRTGDLGRLDAEGYVTISGRIKEIINRGGEKVSPHEVEEALLEHADVRRCAAFAVPHPTLGEDVAAAVALRDGGNATEEELRQFLFGALPEFKIPSHVLVVDEIPTGATGKIRRIGLAERFAERLAAAFVAPRSDTEAFVAGLFSEVLGIERVGATDNFFALGGDSLRGVQVLARLRARRGVNLPPAALFRRPTVAEFAREVEAARVGQPEHAPVPPLVRRSGPGT